MRAYLAVAAKDERVPIQPAVLSAADRAIGEAFPVAADQIRGERWLAPDGGVALLAWSNEPEHELLPPPLLSAPDRVLGYCGYLGDRADEDLLLRSGRLGETADTLGGCFSVFRADANGFEAITSITRSCPVYRAETPQLWIAGSRALLVHLAARTGHSGEDRGIDYDVLALQPMLRHGFFTSDDTPFRGVSSLPNSSTLTARRGGSVQVAARPLPEQGRIPTSRRQIRTAVEPLADALVQAMRPLGRHDRPVQLALTGGRDSRVLAAAMHAAGVPFQAHTHGFGDTPDAVLAARIAETLRIEHRIDLPSVDQVDESPDAVLVEHPLLRAHHVVRACEGMITAFETIASGTSYELQPQTSGQGGEMLRGGWNYNQDDATPTGVEKRIRTVFHAAERFLTPEAAARATEPFEHWRAHAREDRFDALDKLYLFFRVGRWFGGTHAATLMGGTAYHPFLDNRVMRAALALPARWRRDEEAVFELVAQLAPALRKMPLEGKRWRFEAEEARRRTERRAWRAREALAATGGTTGFNWRLHHDDDFTAILREQILAAPPEIFALTGKDQVMELVGYPPKAWTKTRWHVFTISVLLSGIWRQPPPADLPKVRIPIPPG